MAFGLYAQETEKKDREGDPSQEINTAKLGLELANYGYEHKSVLSLIEAAQIISENPLGKLIPVKSEPSTGSEGQKTKQAPEITVEKLIKDAKDLAKNDKTMLAIIESKEKAIQKRQSEIVATKGRQNGAAVVTRRVYSNSSYTDYTTFNAQELAEILVIGDGDTDLDLYVYDANGNSIASDTGYTDNCYVSFTPKWTGTFKIVVKNRGEVYNDYLLLTN
jgi:hypothetical protein